MNEDNADYNKDKEFSEKNQSLFDDYYNSKEFNEKIQKLRNRGTVQIVKKDRSENTLFQTITYLDIILTLNTGSALLVDKKAERYPKKEEYLRNFSIEIISNPTKYGKSDGWGYHIGTTIIKAHINQLGNGFVNPPTIFTITKNFVDEVTRNNDFPLIFNKSTNGLYRSAFRPVPKNILEEYFP